MSIAIPLFKNLTGREAGSNPSIVVSWDLISCAPYIVGTIKMLVGLAAAQVELNPDCPFQQNVCYNLPLTDAPFLQVKAGGSAFFQAFGFSNYVVPIAQVQVGPAGCAVGWLR